MTTCFTKKNTLKTMYNLKKIRKKIFNGPKYKDKNNKFLYHDVSNEGFFKNLYKFCCAAPFGKNSRTK